MKTAGDTSTIPRQTAGIKMLFWSAKLSTVTGITLDIYTVDSAISRKTSNTSRVSNTMTVDNDFQYSVKSGSSTRPHYHYILVFYPFVPLLLVIKERRL